MFNKRGKLLKMFIVLKIKTFFSFPVLLKPTTRPLREKRPPGMPWRRPGGGGRGSRGGWTGCRAGSRRPGRASSSSTEDDAKVAHTHKCIHLILPCKTKAELNAERKVPCYVTHQRCKLIPQIRVNQSQFPEKRAGKIKSTYPRKSYFVQCLQFAWAPVWSSVFCSNF